MKRMDEMMVKDRVMEGVDESIRMIDGMMRRRKHRVMKKMDKAMGRNIREV